MLRVRVDGVVQERMEGLERQAAEARVAAEYAQVRQQEQSKEREACQRELWDAKRVVQVRSKAPIRADSSCELALIVHVGPSRRTWPGRCGSWRRGWRRPR